MSGADDQTFRDIDAATSTAPADDRPGRRVVVTIGIDHYVDWPLLENAVDDATETHKQFRALGFEELVPPILNGAATGKALQKLVTDDLAVLGLADSLVLFFAGHGHSRTRQFEDGAKAKTGYLIPVDGHLPGGEVASWLRLDGWLSEIAQLPPRHILVILDACKSGIALSGLERYRSIDDGEALDLLATRRSRRIITSALHDQRAMDSGPIPGHSLFTGCLLEGLRRGFGDRTLRTLTGSEIGLRLRREVRQYSRSQQIPDVGTFMLDDRGELHIPVSPTSHPEASPPPPPSQASHRTEPRPPESRWRPSPWTFLRIAPIVGDYLDGRAGLRRRNTPASTLAPVLALVAVGWLTQAQQQLISFIGGVGGYLIWLASPAGLAVLCLYLVGAREIPQYRYHQGLRHVAKLLAVIAAIVLVMRLVRAAPIGGDAKVYGYVCYEDGNPVTNTADARVWLADAAGRPASDIHGLDRAGFVSLPVRSWSFWPLTLEVKMPGCDALLVPIDAPSAKGCAATDNDIAEDYQDRHPRPIWKVKPCTH